MQYDVQVVAARVGKANSTRLAGATVSINGVLVEVSVINGGRSEFVGWPRYEFTDANGVKKAYTQVSLDSRTEQKQVEAKIIELVKAHIGL